MPLDNYISAEILATCNALGSEIRGVYGKTADCLNCLKDLIRYLRKDDDEHSVLRQLGEIQVLQSDLLPILKRYGKDKEIFDMILRLLVILLNPALLLYNEELPIDKLGLNVYLSIVSYLQSYKQAFIDSNVWLVLSNHLKELLLQSYSERDEDDRLTVEMILIIIRNVLHIPPDDTSEKRTDDDVNVHDQILWALHLSGMEIFLLYLSRNEDEQQYCLHIMEIVSLMLREQTPETLVNAGQRRTASEKEQDEKKLLSIRQKENEKRLEREKHLSSRRFSGTYYVKNFQSISDREHISHQLLSNMDMVKFDSESMTKRTPKNRLPISDANNSRRSTLSICLFLKEFCAEFIGSSYNVLMAMVKHNLERKRSEDHDDSYYLWSMNYFMEFNRHNNFQLAVISETVSIQTFHYVQTQIDNYYEMLLADKKKTKSWSRRMHLGLKAYKELLETLRVMEQSTDATVKNCAEVIKSNVFYIIEYRELILTLLMNYDQVLFSKLYLEDLIQTAHLFLKMMENYSKSHSLVIQKKRRKSRKKKKAKKAKIESENDTEVEMSKIWDDSVSGDLSAVLQGRRSIPTDVSPFDATSELNFEEQKTEIVYKIQKALYDKAGDMAVALLRAARDLWPENNDFGTPDIEPEDEFLVLREIFFADLPTNATLQVNKEEEEEIGVTEEEEEYSMETNHVAEQQLKFEDFLKRFASSKIVKPCCLLFSNYEKNSNVTNKCLLKLMHRIAWDCKMHALFFQTSLFLVFQSILHNSDINHNPVIQEMSRFAKFILGKFFEIAEKNKKAFVEMLFWKGTREAYEIEEGYGSTQKITIKSLWSEVEEDELKELYLKYKDTATEENDVVDIIIVNISKPRTRREVIARLKHLTLVHSVLDLRVPKSSRSSDWQEAEMVELQTLFEEHKTFEGDIVEQILSFLTVKKNKKAIINKLLELNLINNPKELKKHGRNAKIVHIS